MRGLFGDQGLPRGFGFGLTHELIGLLHAAARGCLRGVLDQLPYAPIIVMANHGYLDHMRCRFANT
jgi:hypothetical protein